MNYPNLSRRLLAGLAVLCFSVAPLLRADDAKAPSPDQTKADITALVTEFLAKNSDPAQHARFWAEDLVYTSSGADVFNKAKIIKEVSAAAAAAKDAKEAGPTATYAAEDILVRPYGTTAALTFRLVANFGDGKHTYFRNSGTFLYRNGQWQAVTWQATKIPPADAK